MREWTTLMDGINQLQLRTIAEQTELKDDQVLVKISRVSLNHRDAKIINGDFGVSYRTPSDPLVPASDASGIIVQVGGAAAAQKWKINDRVLSLMRPTHQTGPTTAEVQADGIGIPQPGVLTEAIGSPRRGKEVVVLLLGTGGVSIAGLQQAKALGLTVIITSSSEAKLERARQLGADYTINYKATSDWATEVLRLTAAKGADIIFETGGAATMTQSIRCVAAGGNISAIGVLSGTADNAEEGQANGLNLIRKNAAIKGINVGPRDRIEEMIREVYEPQQLHAVVDRVFTFDEAREALDYLYSGSHFGKVVIKVE